MFDCYNVLMMFFKSATKVLFFLHICKKKCTFRNFKCIFLIFRVNLCLAPPFGNPLQRYTRNPTYTNICRTFL